ncbi:MAG: acyl carrier protein, partial [Bacteroidetes bacterium]|nr:acyl carrier protein [Bacteroidota bacterium]
MNIVAEELKISVKKFIASSSFTDVSKLQDDTMIFREGYFDSMGFVSLISFLEDNYKVPVTDSDLIEENFESVNAIVNFVGRKESHCLIYVRCCRDYKA